MTAAAWEKRLPMRAQVAVKTIWAVATPALASNVEEVVLKTIVLEAMASKSDIGHPGAQPEAAETVNVV